jgi:hypothetical protein
MPSNVHPTVPPEHLLPAYEFVDWLADRFVGSEATFVAFWLDGFTVVAARSDSACDLESFVVDRGGKVEAAPKLAGRDAA